MKIFSFSSLQHHHRHHYDVRTKLRDVTNSSTSNSNSSNLIHQPCESEVCRHTGNSTHEEIKSHRKKFDWRSSSTVSSSSCWYRSSSSPVKLTLEQHHDDDHQPTESTSTKNNSNLQTERFDSHRRRAISDVSTVSFNTAMLTISTAASPTAASAVTTGRHVVFGEVEVREYDVTVGDHPLCMTGCPLSLDWTYDVCAPLTVDEFELCRTPSRRDRNYLRTSWEHRHKKLVEDGTCSEVEIRRMNRKLHRDRCCNQRITEQINTAFFHCPKFNQGIVVNTGGEESP
jgi:hypothetical protein